VSAWCCLRAVAADAEDNIAKHIVTSMVELKALKLRPTQALSSTSPTPALASYMGVSVLTQLTSLALALPVLGTEMMEVVGRMTGLEVSSLERDPIAMPVATPTARLGRPQQCFNAES
jgi:hypothetical protein